MRSLYCVIREGYSLSGIQSHEKEDWLRDMLNKSSDQPSKNLDVHLEGGHQLMVTNIDDNGFDVLSLHLGLSLYIPLFANPQRNFHTLFEVLEGA